jgi:hypothetical protein
MNYVVNITEVKIIPYSSNSSAVPGQARITGQDEAPLEFKHGTSFHLLSNFDLKNIREHRW